MPVIPHAEIAATQAKRRAIGPGRLHWPEDRL